MSRVIAVLGPTASGKSALALQLAQALDGEIVSCDAMQIYKGMDIGTAKATPAERAAVTHHMLDIVAPTDDYSAARYAVDALHCIENIQRRGKVAIVCGGTGFYWRTLYCGGSDAPKGDEQLRAQLAAQPPELLWQQLQQADPVTAARLNPNDLRRVVRALEVYRLSGRPLSSFAAHGRPRFDALVLGLSLPRETLYRRIDARVDAMLRDGLLNEIARLLDGGLSPACTAMQAIGYKEFVGVVQRGEPLQTAADLCKQSTRRYAKRQLTWLGKEPDLQWVEAESPDLCRQVQQRYSQMT